MEKSVPGEPVSGTDTEGMGEVAGYIFLLIFMAWYAEKPCVWRFNWSELSWRYFPSNLHTCLQLTRGKEKSKQRNIDREDTQAWEGSEWSVKWNVSCSFIPREIRDSLFYRVEDFMSFCTETISCPGPQRARTVLPGWLLLMQEVWVC